MNKSYDSKSFTQTSITVDGKTYNSIDEVPEEHKKQIQDMMNFDFSGEDVTKFSVQHSNGDLGSLDDLSPQAIEFIDKHSKSLFGENAPTDGFNHNFGQINQSSDTANVEQESIYTKSTNVTRNKTSTDSVPREAGLREGPHNSEPKPNTNYQHASAVQKQNTSYGWVSVVVIVGIIAAAVWKYIS